METRLKIWDKLASEWKPKSLLSSIGREINLDQLSEELSKILAGELRGRTIVNIEY